VPLGAIGAAEAGGQGASPRQDCNGGLRGAYSVIRARAVEKRYGSARALRAVSFEVAHRDCLVVTGPNGSGKTTLLRLLAGLAAPTRGQLEVDVDRSQIGFLGHEPLIYRDLTGLENLDLYGRLYRVPERRERIGMLLERFGLWEARARRVSTYSRGMTQRLALCRALLHEPQMLVLDEPFTALDAAGVELLVQELQTLVGERTLVVATHEPDRFPVLGGRRLALA
jgi:ABC-type multidrug transport system ATPase subunit